MRSNPRKFVITGGGTGGHVFPALTIAGELKSRGHEVLYVGSDRGLEAELAPKFGVPLKILHTGGIKNQSILKIFRSLWQLLSATWNAIGALGTFRPNAVLGVGGYVSAPYCLAAYLRGIPVYIQEQNCSVGITNRLLGKLAKRIFLGFKSAHNAFPKNRTLHTGNPIRPSLLGNFPPFDANANHLLIMGGSLGARALNQAMVEIVRSMPHITVTHQTGKADLEAVRAQYVDMKRQAPWTVVPFIDSIEKAYTAASLVVCRSGALTISELIEVGRPAVLVPFPRKGQNDQTANAQFLAHAGAARVVEQGEDFTTRLHSAIVACLDAKEVSKMAAGLVALRGPDAVKAICDALEGRKAPN